MCRWDKTCKGGRRCPSNRGERRRAYQRARYQAKKHNKKYGDTHTIVTPIQPVDKAENKLSEVTEPLKRLTDKQVSTAAKNPEIQKMVDEFMVETSNETIENAVPLLPPNIARVTLAVMEARIEEKHKERDEAYNKLQEKIMEINSGKPLVGQLRGTQTEKLAHTEEAKQYEAATRNLGEAVNFAALIKTNEAMKKAGLSEEDLRNPDLSRFEEGALKHYQENYTTVTEEDQQKAIKRRDKYQKKIDKNPELNLLTKLDAGEKLAMSEVATYIAGMYGDGTKNKITYRKYCAMMNEASRKYQYKYPDRKDGLYCLDENGRKIYPSAYGTEKYPIGTATTGGVITSRRRVGYSHDTDVPTHPDFVRELIEAAKEQTVDMKPQKPSERYIKNTYIPNLYRETYDKAFAQAVQSYAKDSFTNEKIHIGLNKATKDVTAQFEQATTLFPDSMKKFANSNGLELAIRKVPATQRAFVRNASVVHTNEKQDKYYSYREGFGITNYGEKASSNVFQVPQLLSDGNGNFRGEEAKQEYKKMMDDNYPTATPENMTKLKEFAETYNTKGNPIDGSRLLAENHRRKKGDAQYIKVQPETFTDQLGQERIRLVCKKGYTEKTRHVVTELTTDGDMSTTVHETSHYMENSPQVSIACKTFLFRRTEGLSKELYTGTEMCTPDSFTDRYIGKNYEGRNNTEVFSMGMESVFTSARHTLTPKQGVQYNPSDDEMSIVFTKPDDRRPFDTEHRNLIIGIIAGHK